MLTGVSLRGLADTSEGDTVNDRYFGAIDSARLHIGE
jgi:hypothetical protein